MLPAAISFKANNAIFLNYQRKSILSILPSTTPNSELILTKYPLLLAYISIKLTQLDNFSNLSLSSRVLAIYPQKNKITRLDSMVQLA
ncbi:hypothetical protein KCTC52924_01931 [Arenibacter antarcticus]|nr:hypothetical protein [Arenibacter sp. H213]